MKRNTILSLIALIAAVAGVTAAVILFLRKKHCELFSEFDEDEIDGLEQDEDLDFPDVLGDQEEKDCENCCAECSECGEDCCSQEEMEPEASEDSKQNESAEC